MARHIRLDWGRLQGRVKCTVNWDVIDALSVVHITASEAGSTFIPDLSAGGGSYDRFVGAADISIHNVSPFPGGVEFVVYVAWDTPLHVSTDVSVFDKPEQYVQ